MQPETCNIRLADLLQLQNREPLFPLISVPSDEVKFAVFVPLGYEEAIIDAIAQSGGGIIGNYSHCTFRTPGTGTYKPLEGASPWAGEVGKLESAEETRLETRVPRDRIAEVFQRVRAAHPYEEMAYDIYPLENLHSSPSSSAIIGSLPHPLPLRGIESKLRSALNQSHSDIRSSVSGNPSITRIACCLGAPSDVLIQAIHKKPDLIIAATEFDQSLLSQNTIPAIFINPAGAPKK